MAKTSRKGIISQKRIVIQLCHNLSFPHFKSLFLFQKVPNGSQNVSSNYPKRALTLNANAYNLRLSIWYTQSLLKPDICFCIPVSGNSILFFWVTLMKGFSSSGTLLRLSNWSVELLPLVTLSKCKLQWPSSKKWLSCKPTKMHQFFG